MKKIITEGSRFSYCLCSLQVICVVVIVVLHGCPDWCEKAVIAVAGKDVMMDSDGDDDDDGSGINVLDTKY